MLTVKTQEQVANNYVTTNTYCAVAISAGDVKTTVTDKVVVSGSGGTFDETKVTLTNLGTVEDTWTLTFTSSTNFTCAGLYEGAIGNGVISSVFSPTNTNTGQSYFTIPVNAWGGTFSSGNTVTFKSHPACFPLWLKEVVPAGTSPYSHNGVIVEVYVE